jgi:lantibiotic leader peptide-processing serine protease
MVCTMELSRARRPHIPWQLLAGVLLFATATACSDQVPIAPAAFQAATEPLPPSARYIIALTAAGSVPTALATQITAAGGRILRTHTGMGLALVAGLSAQVATALQRAPGVHAVIPDFTMRLIHEPVMRRYVGAIKSRGTAPGGVGPRGNPRNASFFTQQWNMTQIHADSAWQISSQGAGVKVFILDTGVDTAHVDLAGLIDTQQSTSFAYASSDSLMLNPLPFSHDVVGHGSFVSSIIASNSLGVAAVAPAAKLVMVRVLDDSGSGTAYSVLSGILYAADSGADIINMSLGGYLPRNSGSYLSFADYYQRVVDYAAQRGTVLVAAAGNESVNTDSATSPTGSYADSLNTPAGFDHVMSVGATGPVDQVNFDQIAVYSNYGNAGVGVFAPGGNTVDDGSQQGQADLVYGVCSSASSFCPNVENVYLIGAGTSFASPMAAGEAAVVKAQRAGALTGGSLEMCVLVSATDVTGKRPDPKYNYGRIDVLSALTNSSCKSGS